MNVNRNEAFRNETFKEAVNKGLDELDRGEGARFTPELRAQMNQNAERKASEGRKPNPDVCP